MSDDPWKHRSEGMCCTTCMWFIIKEIVGGDHKLDEEKM